MLLVQHTLAIMQCIHYAQAQNSFVGKLEGSSLDFSSSRAELA